MPKLEVDEHGILSFEGWLMASGIKGHELKEHREVWRKFYEAQGCEACGKTGYQGRIGVREVIEVNEEIRQLVMNRGSAGQIKEAAIRNGMTTMIHEGIMRAAQGATTIEEILRIIHE